MQQQEEQFHNIRGRYMAILKNRQDINSVSSGENLNENGDKVKSAKKKQPKTESVDGELYSTQPSEDPDISMTSMQDTVDNSVDSKVNLSEFLAPMEVRRAIKESEKKVQIK